MKVIHISNYLPGYHEVWGGAEQAALRSIRLGIKSGHDLVICTTKRSNDDHLLEDTQNYEIDFEKPEFPWYTNHIFYKEPYLQLKEILLKENPDICHIYNFDRFSISIVQACKELDIPVIFSVFDYWLLCSRRIFLDSGKQLCFKYNSLSCPKCLALTSKKILLYELFYYFKNKSKFRKLIKQIDFFHVLSEDSKNILVEYGIKSNKIKVQPSYFEMKVKEEDSNGERDPKLILFVGWLLFHKGIHIVVEALGKVIKSHPDIKLVVLGEWGTEEEYHQNLRDKIKEYQLEDHIEIKGKMPFDRVVDFLKKASLITIPEQWPNVGPVIIFEAMACKTPILASRIGGIPEMVIENETGFLAEYNNPDDWAEKIIRILNKEEDLSRITNEAFQFAQSKNDKKKANDFFNEIYSEMLRGSL